MFTLLTDQGREALDNLAGNKLLFTKYQIGVLDPIFLSDFRETENDGSLLFDTVNMHYFTSAFEGTDADVNYQFMDTSNTVLKMVVPQDYAYFKLNCAMVYATNNDTMEEFPFIVSYALELNPKFSTTINKFGTRYFFMLQLHLTDREDRFDFSNLQMETPDFPYYEHNYETPNAIKIKQDQLILDNHVNTPESHKIFVVESEGQHYGVLMMPWSIDEMYQNITIDNDDLELGDNPLYVAINSHKSQVILNNLPMDYVSPPDGMNFVILNEDHLVVNTDDPTEYIVFPEGGYNV